MHERASVPHRISTVTPSRMARAAVMLPGRDVLIGGVELAPNHLVR